MTPHVIELAKKAGFVFWGNEPWGPGPGNIDWSSDYTEELEIFVELLTLSVVESLKEELRKQYDSQT